MILLAATASIFLYPVTGEDPRLSEEGTIVSADAEAALEAGTRPVLCLDLPEGASSHERACLTREEWEATLELAEADASYRSSVLARERALTNADVYMR